MTRSIATKHEYGSVWMTSPELVVRAAFDLNGQPRGAVGVG